MSPFPAWGDFHALLSLRKNGGLLVGLVAIRYYRLIIQIFSAAICRYEMMRSCWLENPLMRPTFAEITKRFQYYLQEYKVLS